MDSVGHGLQDFQSLILNMMAKTTLIRRDHYIKAIPSTMQNVDKSFLYNQPLGHTLFDGACSASAASLRADEERDVNRMLLKNQLNRDNRSTSSRSRAPRGRGRSARYPALYRKGTAPGNFRQPWQNYKQPKQQRPFNKDSSYRGRGKPNK